MKYEIQLIRCKEDDVLAQYIVEFFKFIGYFVSDYIVTELLRHYSGHSLNAGITVLLGVDRVKDIKVDDKHDKLSMPRELTESEKNTAGSMCQIDIISEYIYLINKEKMDELNKKRSSLPKCDEEVTKEEKRFYRILDYILEQLPLSKDDMREIKGIHKSFARHGIFFYMYNNGILKFIEGAKPGDSGKKLYDAIHAANNISFDQYVTCLREIFDEKSTNRHRIYASTLLEKFINTVERSKNGRDLFDSHKLLERVERLMKSDEEFIRTRYLASEISQTDDTQRYRAVGYLDKAIEMALSKKGDSESEEEEKGDTVYFLYYKKGQLLEMMGFDKEANESYKRDMDPLKYRAQYKRASYLKRGNERKAIDEWESIITALLNGYGPDNVMPTKRIIAFRACRARAELMMRYGDIEGAKREYEIARECSTLPEVQSVRHSMTKERGTCAIYNMYVEKRSCYRTILQYCMPEYTVQGKV